MKPRRPRAGAVSPRAVLPPLLSIVSFVALGAFVAAGAAPPALESLVEAERDFARLSVERGMAFAFDAYFADDGIWFAPHPERVREALAKRPAGPPTSTLDWSPAWSDVSAAGDLGYNAGPYVVREREGGGKTLEHGFFFSIWKRRADGAWKVAVDFGTGPVAEVAAQRAEPWRAARRAHGAARRGADPEAEALSLRARERELARLVSEKGLPAAYAGNLAEDFRVYRLHELPFVEEGALARRLASEARLGALAWEPAAVETARSADLGYTWGGYTRTPKSGPVETGWYVHAWRRSAAGRWELAVEVMRPAPPADTKPPAPAKEES